MSNSLKKQVLYVDDEPQALKFFARLFGERFEILTAESVDSAIELLAQQGERVGVVITDQRMPVKTGNVLLEYLKHHRPNIVRILTTAYSDIAAAIVAVNAGGAFRYINKPWNEEEVIGALNQAMEYHTAMDDRDRLLREKLTVLHRLIVMDRVRGLATAATALDGRIRNAWEALSSYMKQSPLAQRIRVDMDEIAQMNMIAIARREGESMVKTVQMLVADVVGKATGVERGIQASELLTRFLAANSADLAADDVALSCGDCVTTELESDRGLLDRLLTILVRRIADSHADPFAIVLSSKLTAPNRLQISIRADFGEFTNGQVASFFSAAIPLQRWPMGLDMDLLSGFMLAHHLGGELTIQTTQPFGPGFQIELPLTWGAAATQSLDARWFDTVFDTLEAWEEQLTEEDDA